MRTGLRLWLAAAVALAAVGVGLPLAVASVASPLAGLGAAVGQVAAPELRSEACLGPVAGTLPPAGPLNSSFTDASLEDPDGPLALSFGFGHRGARTPRAGGAPGGERAQILMRSLTLPGWGQATLGRRTSAAFFGLTETAIWGAFAAFRIQVAMREDASLRMARLHAGIDIGGRDEEWRRIIGGYASSDEYNQFVVARDAANLYFSDPNAPPDASDYAAYRAYFEEHKLKGSDTWQWSSAEAQLRYREQRKRAQRAVQRANSALAAAVVNRIVSALHAARVVGHPAHGARSWQFEVVPAACEDATAFQLRVRARF
jgi:hypothetical protein